MNALITSFQRSHDLGPVTPVFSVAVIETDCVVCIDIANQRGSWK